MTIEPKDRELRSKCTAESCGRWDCETCGLCFQHATRISECLDQHDR